MFTSVSYCTGALRGALAGIAFLVKGSAFSVNLLISKVNTSLLPSTLPSNSVLSGSVFVSKASVTANTELPKVETSIKTVRKIESIFLLNFILPPLGSLAPHNTSKI